LSQFNDLNENVISETVHSDTGNHLTVLRSTISPWYWEMPSTTMKRRVSLVGGFRSSWDQIHKNERMISHGLVSLPVKKKK
jgi:hypothetical protein